VSSGLLVSLGELTTLPAVLRAPHRSRSRIEADALSGIQQLLDHACARVPYYRERPEYSTRLASLDGLAALPILDKGQVLDAGVAHFHAAGVKGFHVDHSSGTTGRVIEVRHDDAAYGYHGATILRRFQVSGYRLWWPIVQLKPFPRPVRWFQRLGLFPRTVVDSALPARELARLVLENRPRVLMGYPVVLRGLLRALDDSELTRLRGRLRLVLTDSELLTDEGRALLEVGFGTPVLDEYSAYEVLTVSSQCRSGSMHVDEDRVWLEIVDAAGVPVEDGVEGRVVVTHFRQRAMPLVRYALGDRAVRRTEPCACGMTTATMRISAGRTDDVVVLPDGQSVYTGTFLGLAMHTPGVAESMVHQSADGAITISLVADRRSGLTFEQVAADYGRRLDGHVGQHVEATFREVDHVTITPGGKARFVTSDYRSGARSG
jgi:phenylacetate-CoA ligase